MKSVKISWDGNEKTYQASYHMQKGENDKNYGIIEGAMPVIHVKKGPKDYQISIDEVNYPPALLQ